MSQDAGDMVLYAFCFKSSINNEKKREKGRGKKINHDEEPWRQTEIEKRRNLEEKRKGEKEGKKR